MPLSQTQQNQVLDNQPATVNPLTDVGFRLTIPDLVNVEYFGQKIKLPGMQIPVATQSTPSQNILRPGTAVNYEYLELEFMVDAKLANYFELYNWVFRDAAPIGATLSNYPKQQKDIFKTITVTLLNNKSNAIADIMFYGAWPVKISPLEFNSTDAEGKYLRCTVHFAFIYFAKVA